MLSKRRVKKLSRFQEIKVAFMGAAPLNIYRVHISRVERKTSISQIFTGFIFRGLSARLA